MGFCIVLCFVVRYFGPFKFCNHLDGEERAGCFALSSWCLMIVVWLLTMPWICLQFVIVVFPDHTHLLYILLLQCNAEWRIFSLPI